MQKRICFILSIAIILPLASTSLVAAEPLSTASCKLPNQDPSRVNIGIPVSKDRLGSKATVTVLIAPFEFQDSRFDVDISSLKNRDTNAASLIKSFSRDKVTIVFRYATSIIRDKRTAQGWGDFLRERHVAFSQKDESRSTYGVVREWLVELDKREDLTGVDSVIFQGPLNPLQERQFGAATYEAFMVNGQDSGFFRPFSTTKGDLYNAVIMTGLSDVRTVAHELMHNFGLVDLYGYAGSDQAEGWSLMSSSEAVLFNWELWQLGWIRDEEVVCFDLRGNKTLQPQAFDLTGIEKSGLKMLVLRTSESEVQVAEVRDPVLKPPRGQLLLTYSVSINRYPGPVRTTNRPTITAENDFSIGGTKLLGEIELLVADAELGRVRVGVWSASLSTSSEAMEIRAQGAADWQKRSQALDKQKNELVQAPKKTSITCIKGRTTKKVTAVSPKCPKGYKKVRT